ncbi:MAG TPA: HAMP domain-containing protein, partial [Vicinamibacteria bacterium]
MSKAFQRHLVPSAVAAVVLTLGAALLTESAPFWGRLLASAGAAVGVVVVFALAFRRHLVAPLEGMTAVVAALRAHSGPLPRELPIQRSDEIGALAREVALLAGERNASELRRAESDYQIAALNGAISDAIFRIDRDGVVLSHQPPRDVPFFVTAEPAAGLKLSEVFPESVVDRSVEALTNVFVVDEPQLFDFQLEV